MSSKGLLSIVIGVVVLVGIVTTAIVLSDRPAAAPLPANYYTNSDWIERHPVETPPAEYFAGSDWIERHPVEQPPAEYYAGSDWVERHAQDPFEAAEWAKGAGQDT